MIVQLRELRETHPSLYLYLIQRATGDVDEEQIDYEKSLQQEGYVAQKGEIVDDVQQALWHLVLSDVRSLLLYNRHAHFCLSEHVRYPDRKYIYTKTHAQIVQFLYKCCLLTEEGEVPQLVRSAVYAI